MKYCLFETVCFFICIFVCTADAAYSSKLPKGFVQCKLSDPNISECIKNGLQRAAPHLVKGVPSLGLLPLDPMRINMLTIDQGVGAVKLKLIFRNLDIFNMKSVIVKDVKFDPKKYLFHIALTIQKPLVLEGLYEANGKVLILPIVGNGTCKIALDDMKSFSVIQLKIVEKNDNKYFEIDHFSFTFVISKLHIKLDNLFNGDKILGENMNIFLNENWKELLNEMQPAFEEALRAAIISIANEFFKRIPVNEIFLD